MFNGIQLNNFFIFFPAADLIMLLLHLKKVKKFIPAFIQPLFLLLGRGKISFIDDIFNNIKLFWGNTVEQSKYQTD